MKTTKIFAYACAIALVSTVGFTSCKKDEPRQQVPQVNTDITLSLPTQVGGAMRRMPGATVQTNGATDFDANGMKSITLIPFAKKEKVSVSSTRLGDSNIDLGTLGATISLSADANGRTKVFTGKNVPLGASAFLFYGESNKTSSNKFEIGSLTGSFDAASPASYTFSLEAIQPNASTVDASAAYTGLIKYLNHVANAQENESAKAWKDYTTVAGDNEGFVAMADTFKTAKVLSSFGIQRMMTDLYQSIKTNSDAIAAAIRDSIATAEFATVDGDGNVTLVASLQNFPQSFGLPVGCIAVAYSTSEKVFGGNAVSAFGGLDPAAINNFVYPPSLWYYANSQIKASSSSKESSYTTPASWASVLATYEKDNASVVASTRSIAIKDTIQYAVARLDVQLKFKEGTTLVDNDPNTTANVVTNPVAGYPLKAVLVGGQKNVGFDFTPGVGTAYTVYDTVMTSDIAAVSTSYSAANSTLVLESAEDEDEYIAIELVNTSDKDFYGYDGIVPVGGRFYLVGKLAAASATETGNKVFKQDYTTTARIAIKDLKSAYNTIPDLKAPQLEIGLAIDLTWQTGHTYDLEL
ncbi:MAG: hypothetical protein IJQ97_00020 [Paludibacteraceae bacterium]|nr:hypothetical protein [Paludibacteraceae bacterium]